MDEKEIHSSQEWLETATKGIRLIPEHLAVEAELRFAQVESRLTIFTWIWIVPSCCKRGNAACGTPFSAQRFGTDY